MLGVFRSELLKLRKSPIGLLVLVSPVLSSIVMLFSIDADQEYVWMMALSIASLLHAMIFLPMLTGVFAAFLCRYEHAQGGWKQMLALPIRRMDVFIVKWTIVMGLLAITQLLLLGGLVGGGLILGISDPIPWEFFLKCMLGGWIACFPLAALQMTVSVAWSSFAAPLALNFVLTMPSVLVANSAKYGPYYPWAQPFLAMIGQADDSLGFMAVSPLTLYVVILGSFVLWMALGLITFQRKVI